MLLWSCKDPSGSQTSILFSHIPPRNKTSPPLMNGTKVSRWALSSTVPFPTLSHVSSDSEKDMPRWCLQPCSPPSFLPFCLFNTFGFSSLLLVLPVTKLKSFLHLKANPKTVLSFMCLTIFQKNHTLTTNPSLTLLFYSSAPCGYIPSLLKLSLSDQDTNFQIYRPFLRSHSSLLCYTPHFIFLLLKVFPLCFWHLTEQILHGNVNYCNQLAML